MIFIEAKQGTPEWHQARCGVVTASCFADAISMVGALDEKQQAYVDAFRKCNDAKLAATMAGYKAPPTSTAVARVLKGGQAGIPSDTAHRYAADVAMEQVSGQPQGEPPKAWVLERGHEMEAKARMLYEARTGAYVTEAGICLTDDRLHGYSTDGLVDDDGLIEIKAPIDTIKIYNMLRTQDTAEYAHQMFGGMWITGRAWCDFIQYVPQLANSGKDLFIKRIYRNDVFIDDMVQELARFQLMIAEYKIAFSA
jgi:exodeoxyribonuclease (lambda-induced)